MGEGVDGRGGSRIGLTYCLGPQDWDADGKRHE